MWKPLGAVRGILCAMPPASPPAPTHAPRDWAGAPSSDADPQAGPAGGATAMRLDKWLWAARWFKTRSLAADAVSLGRVRVNGQAVKPARDLRPGDRVTLHGPMGVRTVDVRALSAQRGPASVAQALYAETPESLQAQAEARAQRRLAPEPATGLTQGRPTKRDRRRLDAWAAPASGDRAVPWDARWSATLPT